jgi:hypothetical protein
VLSLGACLSFGPGARVPLPPGRLSLSPLPPLHRVRGVPRRAQGVGLTVLLGLAALLQQPGGGLLDAPAPINCQQAESDSSSARPLRPLLFSMALDLWGSGDQRLDSRVDVGSSLDEFRIGGDERRVQPLRKSQVQAILIGMLELQR